MKKIITILLLSALVLSLCACGNKPTPEEPFKNMGQEYRPLDKYLVERMSTSSVSKYIYRYAMQGHNAGITSYGLEKVTLHSGDNKSYYQMRVILDGTNEKFTCWVDEEGAVCDDREVHAKYDKEAEALIREAVKSVLGDMQYRLEHQITLIAPYDGDIETDTVEDFLKSNRVSVSLRIFVSSESAKNSDALQTIKDEDAWTKALRDINSSAAIFVVRDITLGYKLLSNDKAQYIFNTGHEFSYTTEKVEITNEVKKNAR